MTNSDFSCVETRFFSESCHCAVLQTQFPKLCTDLDLSLLYILILGTYSKFTRKNCFPSAQRLLSAVLLERWPQVCREKITFTNLLTNRFVSTTKKSMKCIIKWIPLRIRVRSRNTQPHLKLFKWWWIEHGRGKPKETKNSALSSGVAAVDYNARDGERICRYNYMRPCSHSTNCLTHRVTCWFCCHFSDFFAEFSVTDQFELRPEHLGV